MSRGRGPGGALFSFWDWGCREGGAREAAEGDEYFWKGEMAGGVAMGPLFGWDFSALPGGAVAARGLVRNS